MRERLKQSAAMLATALLLWGAVGAAVQPEQQPNDEHPDVPVFRLLIAASERVRLALHLATMAVLAPTLSDQQLHARQIVALLEGTPLRGEPSPEPEDERVGLIADLEKLILHLPHAPVPPRVNLERVVLLLRTAQQFLRMSLEEAHASLRERSLEAGREHMLKVFAFTSAALGRELDPLYASLGGLIALRHLLGVAPSR